MNPILGFLIALFILVNGVDRPGSTTWWSPRPPSENIKSTPNADIDSIMKEGWTLEASVTSLEECAGDTALALSFLQDQEVVLQTEYYNALAEMVRNMIYVVL